MGPPLRTSKGILVKRDHNHPEGENSVRYHDAKGWLLKKILEFLLAFVSKSKIEQIRGLLNPSYQGVLLGVIEVSNVILSFVLAESKHA